jgi:hypothetical protein
MLSKHCVDPPCQIPLYAGNMLSICATIAILVCCGVSPPGRRLLLTGLLRHPQYHGYELVLPPVRPFLTTWSLRHRGNYTFLSEVYQKPYFDHLNRHCYKIPHLLACSRHSFTPIFELYMPATAAQECSCP